MRGCALLTRKPTHLAFRAAPLGPLAKRVTKPRGSQREALNACWALSSRHAHVQPLWNTSRKNRLVAMVGAGDSNSDLPFACPTLSQARRAPRKCPGYLRRRPLRRGRSCFCAEGYQMAGMDVVIDPTWTIVSGRDAGSTCRVRA